jgi:hypothetical protein
VPILPWDVARLEHNHSHSKQWPQGPERLVGLSQDQVRGSEAWETAAWTSEVNTVLINDLIKDTHAPFSLFGA